MWPLSQQLPQGGGKGAKGEKWNSCPGSHFSVLGEGSSTCLGGPRVDTLHYQKKLPVCNILEYRKVLVDPDVPGLGRKPGVSPAETLNVPFLS